MVAHPNVITQLKKKYPNPLVAGGTDEFISHRDFLNKLLPPDDIEEIQQNDANAIASLRAEIKKMKREGNPRDILDAASRTLQTWIAWTQTYLHLEYIGALRLALPLGSAGILIFVISAGLGDINFHNEVIQTIVAVGCVISLGLVSAAYFLRTVLYRSWCNNVENSLKDYKKQLDQFLEKNLSLTPDPDLTKLIDENVEYARYNWYHYSEEDGPKELNMVGFRQKALYGQTDKPDAVMMHEYRKKASNSWTILLNLGALICAVFLSGLIHERRRSIYHKKNQLEDHGGSFQSTSTHSNHHDIFGSDWAMVALVGLAVLAVAAIALQVYKQRNAGPSGVVRLGATSSVIPPTNSKSVHPTSCR